MTGRKRTDILRTPSRYVEVLVDGVVVCGENVFLGIDATNQEVEAAAITYAQHFIGKSGKYTATVDWRQ